MTDYEAKFYGQGLPICRCVGTMVPWEEPFPTDIRRVKNRWLDVFAEGVSEAELGKPIGSDARRGRSPSCPSTARKNALRWSRGSQDWLWSWPGSWARTSLRSWHLASQTEEAEKS